jgi:hypothetical protein
VVNVNKTIISFIISIALISGIVLAADTGAGVQPCPLAFTFLTSPPGAAIGQDVTLQYLDRIFTGQVNEYGELVMDLGSEGIPSCTAQNFKLTVLGCKDNPVCSQTVSFNPNGYTTIDISTANLFDVCPACLACDTCPTYQSCMDQGYILPSTCPVPIVPEVDYLGYLATALIALGAGYGIRRVKTASGAIQTQHTHPNYTSMHDINTLHKHQPHPRGMLMAKYATTKSSDGYYKYLG